MTAAHSQGTSTTRPAESARFAEQLRAHALAYAERGWHVFPLISGGNVPAIKGWQDRATIDPERIERAWTPGAGNAGTWNIGIACGPSGLLVVDLDVAKDDETGFAETGVDGLTHLAAQHGAIPDTYTVATPSGGRHLYFTAPTETPTAPPTGAELRDVQRVQLADDRVDEAGIVMGLDPGRGLVLVAWDSSELPTVCELAHVRPYGQPRVEPVQVGNTVGRLHHEIDTRGIGGYVVAAGSIRPHGAYTASPVRFDGDPYTSDPNTAKTTAALPDWLLGRLWELSDRSGMHERSGLPAEQARRRAYLDKIVSGELARVLDSGPDRHNDALFIASAHLGELIPDGHLDENTLRSVLVAAGQRVGQPAKEAAATVESGLRNGTKTPRHIDPGYVVRVDDHHVDNIGRDGERIPQTVWRSETELQPAPEPVNEAVGAAGATGEPRADNHRQTSAGVQTPPDARPSRFSEDDRVRARYPLPGDNRDDRSTWHWLPAIVIEAIDDPVQGEEYLVVIDDDRLAEVDQSGETTYPSAFRERGDLLPMLKPPDDPPTASETATGELARPTPDSPGHVAADDAGAVNEGQSSARGRVEPSALSEPVAERLARSATRRPTTSLDTEEAAQRNYVEAGVRGLYATELAAGNGEPNTVALAQLGQLRGGGYLHPSTVYAATCHCCAPGRSRDDCDTRTVEQALGEDAEGADTAEWSGQNSNSRSESGAGEPDDPTVQVPEPDHLSTGMAQRSSLVEKARLAAAEFGARLSAAEQRARARAQRQVDGVSSPDVRGRGEALSW